MTLDIIMHEYILSCSGICYYIVVYYNRLHAQCMCIYIHMHTHVDICIHVHISTYTYIYIYIVILPFNVPICHSTAHIAIYLHVFLYAALCHYIPAVVVIPTYILTVDICIYFCCRILMNCHSCLYVATNLYSFLISLYILFMYVYMYRHC